MADMKPMSCGILLLNEDGEVLLAHATGTTHWDLPKGHAEEGETARVAAVRETREETGLELDPDELIDLGRFDDYRPEKALHLFAAHRRRDEVRLDKCTCITQFQHRTTGAILPETDAYMWVKPTQIEDYCCRSLHRLFATRLSLYDVHTRVQEALI
jgi:8-oxo-dGTP pyrophosphatase MutT (NUDIX family)